MQRTDATATSASRRATPDVSAAPAVRQSTVLACICACTILVVGFVASINLAVPELADGALAPSPAQLLWIVDAYVLFFACLVIPAGALGDRLGRKGVLLTGLLVFAGGAIVSATAADVPVMLVGRAVTGIGAAGVLPNALAVLIHATDAKRRPHAIAVWAAMSGVGGVVGNIGGGSLLAAGSWRWLFAAVSIVAIGCCAWVAKATPRSERHNRTVDPIAAALLTTATLALLVGIVEGPGHGWGSAVVVSAFAVAAVLFVGWTVVGLRAAQPLLDPRLFRIPAVRAACLGMVIVFFGMFGFFYLNASLLQYARGFTVLQTGVAVVPLTVPLLVAARFVPRLTRLVGDRTVLAAAFLLTAAGLFGLGSTVRDTYLGYAGWMVVAGCGITLALPTLTIAISAALPREQAGVAGGLQATTREFGSALGVAVIGTLLTADFARRLAGIAHGAHAAGTVALALTRFPAAHHEIISAYADTAGTALKTVALVVVVAGVLVIGEMTWARRRSA
jgi:MFS family permease